MHIVCALLHFPPFKNIDTNCIIWYIIGQRIKLEKGVFPKKDREITQIKYEEHSLISQNKLCYEKHAILLNECANAS